MGCCCALVTDDRTRHTRHQVACPHRDRPVRHGPRSGQSTNSLELGFSSSLCARTHACNRVLCPVIGLGRQNVLRMCRLDAQQVDGLGGPCMAKGLTLSPGHRGFQRMEGCRGVLTLQPPLLGRLKHCHHSLSRCAPVLNHPPSRTDFSPPGQQAATGD